MSKKSNGAANRLLAILLVLFMVISLLPSVIPSAFADSGDGGNTEPTDPPAEEPVEDPEEPPLKLNLSSGDFTVTGKNALTDGTTKACDLVTIETEVENVTFVYGGDAEKKEAGEYKVSVTATKDGYNDLSLGDATVEILTIPYKITAYSGVYDRSAHDAVSVDQIEDASTENFEVSYRTNCGEEYSTICPTITAIGTMSVSVMVEYNKSGTSYEPFVKDYKAEISGLTVTYADGLVYTGKAQKLVEGVKVLGGYTVTYSLDGVNYAPEVPTGTDAGEYVVYVEATNEPTKFTDHATVTIEKASLGELALYENRAAVTGKELELGATVTLTPMLKPEGENAEFAALTDEEAAAFTCSLTAVGDENKTKVEQTLEKDENGIYSLIVKIDETGTYSLDAEIGDANHTTAVSVPVTVISDGSNMTLTPKAAAITLNTDNSKNSVGFTYALKGEKGKVTVSVSDDNFNVNSNGSSNGSSKESSFTVSVKPAALEGIIEKLAGGETVSVTVTVTKAEQTEKKWPWEELGNADTVVSKEAVKSAEVTVSLAEFKSELAYSGTRDEGNEWFKIALDADGNITPVTVTAEGYTLSLTPTGGYAATAEIDHSVGDNEYIYAADSEGYISAVKIGVKIDLDQPTIESVKVKTDGLGKILAILSLGLYQPPVKAEVSASDVTSGISRVCYKFINWPLADGVTEEEAFAAAQEKEADYNKGVYTFKVEENSKFKIYVIDKAGNISGDVNAIKDGDDSADRFIFDAVAPEVAIGVTGVTGGQTSSPYYSSETVTAVATAKDENLGYEHKFFVIIGKEDCGAAEELSEDSKTATITASIEIAESDKNDHQKDGVYEISAGCTDVAGNTGSAAATVIIDTTVPTAQFGFNVPNSYAEDPASNYYCGDASTKYYGGDIEGTLAVTEVNFDSGLITIGGLGSVLVWNGQTASFTLTDEGEYKLTASGTDKANNALAEVTADTLVIDRTAPTATLTFNTPVNSEGETDYFNGNITGTVTVTEEHFDAALFTVRVEGQTVGVNWNGNVGTFAITGDGKYSVTVNGADKAGNTLATLTSRTLVVDTQMNAPVITVNGSAEGERAFSGSVNTAVTFEDTNLDTYTVRITRTNKEIVDQDVTASFTKNVNVNDTTGSISFSIPQTQDNDGIYTVTATITDKARHESSTTIIYTVNRFGSVYEYSANLIDLIADGGKYVTSVEKDLVITEYNPTRLKNDGGTVQITLNGKPIDAKVNLDFEGGRGSWYKYTYTISKDNFEEDGVYKINVVSEDSAGNNSGNGKYEDMNIAFRKDGTAPDISRVAGLEKPIINATSQTVSYTVFDAIGLKSVTVYVDGKQVGEPITEFDDVNNFSGEFALGESKNKQTVRIVVEDLAGNVSDTDGEAFAPAYKFNRTVTVSTNFFIRWYANKGVFWGSLAAVAAAAVIIVLLAKKKSKKTAEAK